MPTFIFFIAICLLVVASILLETDASPKPNKKLEKGPSSSGNAESTPGPTPENPWAARHEDLTLIEPDGLIVQNNGKNSGCRSVRAKLSIPKSDIFYYEVKILKKVKGKGAIYIGLATKETPLDECVGQSVGTYAYGSGGYFWGHEDGQCLKGSNGWPFIVGKPKFGPGHVIGCSVDLAKRQIIYTKDGKRLETTGLSVAKFCRRFVPVHFVVQFWHKN